MEGWLREVVTCSPVSCGTAIANPKRLVIMWREGALEYSTQSLNWDEFLKNTQPHALVEVRMTDVCGPKLRLTSTNDQLPMNRLPPTIDRRLRKIVSITPHTRGHTIHQNP